MGSREHEFNTSCPATNNGDPPGAVACQCAAFKVLPFGRKDGDRFHSDGVLCRTFDAVQQRRDADIDRQQVISQRRSALDYARR